MQSYYHKNPLLFREGIFINGYFCASAGAWACGCAVGTGAF